MHSSRLRRILVTAGLVIGEPCLVACGASPPPEPHAPSSAAEPEPAKEGAPEGAAKAPEDGPATSSKIPTACASENDGVCAVPRGFLSKLCADTFPNVALVLFGAGTPWTHGYLTRKTEAWNAEGGASMNDSLEFDEEVILLAARMPPKGGMQVSGAFGGYQALRWNGSCVTLSGEEVTTRKPPKPKHPRLEWRYLEDGVRDGLRKDPQVDAAASSLKRECHGVSVGDVSRKCVEADTHLVDAIVRYVTETGPALEPAKLP